MSHDEVAHFFSYCIEPVLGVAEVEVVLVGAENMTVVDAAKP